MCLLQRLTNLTKHDVVSINKFICTSYDSYETLHEKYPEVSYILNELNRSAKSYCKDKDISDMLFTRHDIDATVSLRDQLRDVISSEESMHYIIFNFPHLAHIMTEALALLHRYHTSYFVLALSEAQAKRWKMIEMANRVGLSLSDTIPIIPSDWPGYEFKRHQNAKSFKARLDDCMHYCFVAQSKEEMISCHTLSATSVEHQIEHMDCDTISDQAPLTIHSEIDNCLKDQPFNPQSSYISNQSTSECQDVNHQTTRTESKSPQSNLFKFLHHIEESRRLKGNTSSNKRTLSASSDHADQNSSNLSTLEGSKDGASYDLDNNRKHAQGDAITSLDPLGSHNIPLSHSHGAKAIKSKPSKRRRVPNLTKDMYELCNDSIIDTSSHVMKSSIHNASWKCLQCDRRFLSEQAVQTHCYTVHILAKTGNEIQIQDNSNRKTIEGQGEVSDRNEAALSVDSRSSLEILPGDHNTSHGDQSYQMNSLSSRDKFECSICGRSYANEHSLNHHRVNKHGRFDTVIPTSAFPSSDEIAAEINKPDDHLLDAVKYECKICGWDFPNESSLQSHLTSWKPIDKSKTFLCTVCEKSFGEERALRQHMNYCYTRNLSKIG